MLLQVHDELVFEIAEDDKYLEESISQIKQILWKQNHLQP